MPKDLAGKSVRVVYDEPTIMPLLKNEFADFHAEVSLAESGKAALVLLKEKSFDIVVSDMKMPDGDGLDIIRHIQQKRPEIHVAIITEYASNETAIGALKAEAIEFVTKQQLI